MLNSTKKVLGIVPARKGSKRVPDKNFRNFGGKPLFTHVVDSALKSTLLTDIVISTDHPKIIEYATLNYPGVRALSRPPELSEDGSPALDYVDHVLAFMKRELNKTYDIVVILQPSSPFTLPEDIDNTISLLVSSGADSAVSVVRLDHMVHPFKMKQMVGDKLVPFIEEEKNRMAAHELPEIFVRNCSVYASKTDVIINKRSIIGDDCRGYTMPYERSVDINEMIDFEFAEFLYNKRKK